MTSPHLPPHAAAPPALTAGQIELVRLSFARVRPMSRMVAELFYARLFAIAPQVQPLFHADMAEQGAKLMATLGFVVAGLGRLDALLPAVGDLARRHVTYGVTEAHYAPVGDALIWTLKQGLGDEFTPEVEAAWATAYGLLSTAMVEAARTGDPSAAAHAAE